jgi:hypothetical protein
MKPGFWIYNDHSCMDGNVKKIYNKFRGRQYGFWPYLYEKLSILT